MPFVCLQMVGCHLVYQISNYFISSNTFRLILLQKYLEVDRIPRGLRVTKVCDFFFLDEDIGQD